MSSHISNRPFGNTGLNLPLVWFSAGALANVPHVLPDQAKLELVGEWLKQVRPQVVVEVTADEGAAKASAILGRAIRHFDVPPRELVVSLRCAADAAMAQVESLHADCTRNLGNDFAPQLVALDCGRPGCDPGQVADSLELLQPWKSSGRILAVGLCASDIRLVEAIQAQAMFDWVTLRGCLTIVQHSPEAVALAAKLHGRGIPIVTASALHSGFLAGGNQFDGSAIDPHNDADQHLLAWRKSFAALCHGHSVTPVHAAIQFALRMPGVHAVRVSTSHPDRVGECVAAAAAAIPANFWTSMQEEGLLEGNDLQR